MSTDGHRATLVCFPYSGGSSIAYRGWRLADVRVVAVDYPGHLMRPQDDLQRTMEDLVAFLAPEVEPLLRTPYALCGSSLGALVAFEFAKRAEATGRPPAALLVAACAGPRVLPRHKPIGDVPSAQFLAAVAERYGGLDDAVLQDPELRDLVLPILRCDIELFDRYAASAGGSVACDVVAVAGAHDPAATVDDVTAWRDATTGDYRLRLVDGDHFLVERAVDVLDELWDEIRSLLLPS